MTVTLRKRELKDKGRFALYLDIYMDKKRNSRKLEEIVFRKSERKFNCKADE